MLSQDLLRAGARQVLARTSPRRSLEDALLEYGPAARARLQKMFVAVGASYPARQLVLIGLKREKRLELWDNSDRSTPRLIHSYHIDAASGGPGPKMREGDRQVPEGLYPITYLNPNSRFHLSLRIGYPSAEDRARAAEEGRGNLGGDIMIHGEGGSVGCLSMQDEAAEDLFVAAADTGIRNIDVILAPYDMRNGREADDLAGQPDWLAARYRRIEAAMMDFTAA